MKGKAKKQDPEKLKRQFEEYQQSEEYRHWQKLLQLKKVKFLRQEFSEFSETSHDITGDWQRYHDEMFKWSTIFKTKTK